MARQGAEQGEVPVGAVLVRDGKLLAQACNQPIALQDPTAHAEILALREAARLEGNYRLPGSELFVTIEPCIMCAGALVHGRVSRLVFAAREPKAGAVCSHFQIYEQAALNHKIQVEEGLLEAQCAQLMRDFFKKKRADV